MTKILNEMRGTAENNAAAIAAAPSRPFVPQSETRYMSTAYIAVTKLLKWMKGTADNVAAAMLAAMFLTFLLQIVTRYVVDAPLGWTVEVCLTLWLWLVFWASSFCAKERDHIRFDALYLIVPRKAQRVFAIIAAIGVIIGFLYSFLPTLDYITFYKIKKSAILKIRMDYVFSIYGVFILALVSRYSWRLLVHIHPALYKRFEDQGKS